MKRTPLKRKTPLRKINKKRQAMLDRTIPDRNAWIAEQGNFCWHCGYVPDNYGDGSIMPIQTHEMARKSESFDAFQRCNYFRFCHWCHGEHGHGAMKIEKMLALKLIYDPEHYDLEAVRKMRTEKIIKKLIEQHHWRFINEKGRRK